MAVQRAGPRPRAPRTKDQSAVQRQPQQVRQRTRRIRVARQEQLHNREVCRIPPTNPPCHELLAAVDAHFVRRENRPVGVESDTDVVSEIARLRASIDRAAAASELALTGVPPTSEDDALPAPLAEHRELCRQLAAVRQRVALADDRNEGPRALRAELATLLFFANTLEADTDSWRSTLGERINELERQRTAARRERERLAAERERLVRCRDALQLRIVQTAARIAQRNTGECRKTLPMSQLGDGLSVCSVSVSCPRKGLRVAKRWLVTLNDSRDDVLVRRD